jgi:hypothetical protein
MTLIVSERPDVGSQQLARHHSIDWKAIPLDQFNYVTVDRAVDSQQVDGKQCRLLCDLVDGLTRTRDEAGVRSTIREWTGRARSAGLDPDKVLDLFRRTKGDVHSASRDGWSWTNPDKREFVLVCIEVYSRAGPL